MGKIWATNEDKGCQRKVKNSLSAQCHDYSRINCSKMLPSNAFDAACATSPICPPEVSLRATRSRGSSTAAGRETKIIAGKTRRGNGSDTTTSLTNSCGARTRPSGAKATVRSGPRRRGTTTATRTAPIAETNWGKRTETS